VDHRIRDGDRRLFLLANVWDHVPDALLTTAVYSTGALLVASGIGYLFRTSRAQRARVEDTHVG